MLAFVGVNKNNSLIQVSTGAPSDAQSFQVLWASSDWCVTLHMWQHVLHKTRTAIPHHLLGRSHLTHMHIQATYLTWLYLPTEQTTSQLSTLHLLHSDTHIFDNLLTQVLHKFIYMHW